MRFGSAACEYSLIDPVRIFLPGPAARRSSRLNRRQATAGGRRYSRTLRAFSAANPDVGALGQNQVAVTA
jgi:hypothetical protein